MNSPINLSIPWAKPHDPFELENIFTEEASVVDLSNRLFTEAVFADGKATVAPLLECIRACKDELMAKIQDQDDSVKEINDYHKTPKGEAKAPTPPKRRNFDPVAYWKSKCWKDLEDKMCEIFGFRTAQIMPYREKYNSKDKDFQTKELNAFVYSNNRYPIEALVTDKGLYDKSKSLFLDMRISLGVVKELTPEEILGVMLHEIGHGIDPALVDIRFLETNILSKYITDRKNKINKDEQKAMKGNKLTEIGVMIIAYISIFALLFLPDIIAGIKKFFMGKKKYNEKQQKKRLDRIKQAMNSDKRQFNRQVYTEAFADNFARMYGYAAPLMSGLKKISVHYDKELASRYSKEEARQEIITRITVASLNDVHKTDIHRCRALLREYENDLKDPNIPEAVKKQIREDKEELDKVLNCYFNEFDAFQNRVNKLIDEELQKLDQQVADGGKAVPSTGANKNSASSEPKKPEKKDNDKEKKDDKKDDDDDGTPLKESVFFFRESKEAYEKLKKAKESLNPSERAEVKKKFGDTACSFAKDKDGYYCFTHRCRSKSYPSIAKIPKSKVDFVCSTA